MDYDLFRRNEMTINHKYAVKPEIFVIGGESLYKEAIAHPDCNKIYLTKIYKSYASGLPPSIT